MRDFFYLQMKFTPKLSMRVLQAYILLIFFISFYSCSNDEDLDLSPDVSLAFSTDTVFFDTLFTGFASTTKQLKIYNPSSGKINISEIALENSDSPFRLNIDGIQTSELHDIILNSNDSLFVFVEVALEPEDKDEARLLDDKLIFEVNGNRQKLVLSAWVQDVYLVNENIQTSQNWSGKRPFLIETPVWVNAGVNLTIQEGVRIYFRKNAGFHINGSIRVEGSFGKPVLFSSSRLEELYDNVPGQWDGISFYAESTSNSFSHFILENGISGIKKEGDVNMVSDIVLEYGVIKNFNKKGISITNSNFSGHDLIVSNCGEECLFFNGKGVSELYHSSLYNSWYFAPRSSPVIGYNGDDESSFTMGNTILRGTRTNELELSPATNVLVENCLIKLSNSKQDEYAANFTDCIFNEDPLFADVENNDFSIANISPCINKGKPEYGDNYPFDFFGIPRNIDDAPDMGAVEFTE